MTRPGAWGPTAATSALRARATLLADLRAFFAERSVMEVETPVLSSAGNSDPNLRPLRCEGGGPWLRTSPEYAIKRLLAAGAGDVYELGRVFRGGESGRRHNIEFTLLEWYRVGWDHLRLADEVLDLIRQCGRGDFDERAVERHGYRELFLRYAGCDPFTADDQAFANVLGDGAPPASSMARRDWLDLVYDHIVSRRLPSRSIVVVTDFPADQAALARVRPGDPPLAERFEVILDRRELANGYHELTDAAEQRRRFDAENRARNSRGEAPVPLDEHLLTALEHGLPACAGVALGVDRLLMSLLAVDDISKAIAFPDDRA